MTLTYLIFKFLHIWSLFAIISLSFSLLLCLSSANIFKASGKNSYYSFIPIYNLLYFLDIVELNRYYFITLMLPATNILIIFYSLYRLTIIKRLKPTFSLGLIFLPVIFLPILNYKKDKTIKESESKNIDINLMSDEELKNIVVEEKKVDNVFKIEKTIEMQEVPKFKANKIKYREMMIDNGSLNNIKEIKPTKIDEISKETNVDNKNEDDSIEIIEL